MHTHPHMHVYKPTFNLIHINEDSARGKGFIHFTEFSLECFVCKVRSPAHLKYDSLCRNLICTQLREYLRMQLTRRAVFRKNRTMFRGCQHRSAVGFAGGHVPSWLVKWVPHRTTHSACFSWISLVLGTLLVLAPFSLCWIPFLQLYWLYFQTYYLFLLLFMIMIFDIMTILKILMLYITFTPMCFRPTLNWQDGLYTTHTDSLP